MTEMKLNERQREFLRAMLDGKERHSGMVFRDAFPDAPYKGRRDAGATRTLLGMEKLKLVRGSYGLSPAGLDSSMNWTITEQGRAAFYESQGISTFRVWFMGGNHADVKATTPQDAAQGPWNPTFGAVDHVEYVVPGA
jgi:hypothetical protein